jgi:hypothetical protein
VEAARSDRDVPAAQVVDMFGTDMYVAAIIAVLVIMGLMKGAQTLRYC